MTGLRIVTLAATSAFVSMIAAAAAVVRVIPASATERMMGPAPEMAPVVTVVVVGPLAAVAATGARRPAVGASATSRTARRLQHKVRSSG